MPLPIIADTMRVAIEGLTGKGVHWANVMHFRKTSALTYVGAIAILDPKLLAHLNVNSGAGDCWRVSSPSSASVVQFRYTPLDGTTASTINPHAIAGTLAAVELPDNVALVVSLHTARRGRSYRGRVYQGPQASDQNGANGVPLLTHVNAVTAQWQGFLTSLAGSGVSLVVASYRLATAEDVVSISVDRRWDSQRRRLGR